ncbi:MAG: putative SAM-dependent methyltransferase [Pedosphaera sp.]|nr:putative SAM-dependent methyltransferase [Pedosphaera sp.]
MRVTATAESILRSGHPWLFADSIHEQNRPGQIGELAVVYDRKDKFLAVGLLDPDSPIRVRILHAGKPQNIDQDWWRAHLDQTLAVRRPLFDAHTTGYRCINGESDGWPGLVLDRYDTTLVLKLYTAAWLPRLEEVVSLILASPWCSENIGPEARVVLRLSRNIQSVAGTQFKHSDGEILRGPPLVEPVVFLESGLRFEADVLRGQKTGFFLDQRENRRRVETLSRGRAVLNAFSFSGGFSLYAARGGARSVTDLDLSAHALASAKRNFALNEAEPTVARCPHETVQADTFEWLAENSKRRFDLVILDPPSLAKRETERAGAIRAYGRLAELGMNCLNRGGILLAASCSAHVTAEEFFEAVRQSAVRSGRKFTELQTTRHAPDHPAKIKEAEYLKAIYLAFS